MNGEAETAAVLGEGESEARSMQKEVSLVLRSGLALAVVLVAVGGVLYLIQAAGTAPDYGTFDGVPVALRDPITILRDALHGEALALIQLGLIVLVLTPVARVVFTLVAFVRQRDLLYVMFTLIVLVVLSLSLTGHGL